MDNMEFPAGQQKLRRRFRFIVFVISLVVFLVASTIIGAIVFRNNSTTTSVMKSMATTVTATPTCYVTFITTGGSVDARLNQKSGSIELYWSWDKSSSQWEWQGYNSGIEYHYNPALPAYVTGFNKNVMVSEYSNDYIGQCPAPSVTATAVPVTCNQVPVVVTVGEELPAPTSATAIRQSGGTWLIEFSVGNQYYTVFLASTLQMDKAYEQDAGSGDGNGQADITAITSVSFPQGKPKSC